MRISVIICTHNPRSDYLRKTLDALKEQTLSKTGWELLLIDNASKESVAEKWDLTWHPLARHVHEGELGLTPARLRGIREAKGEVIVFVDDDNVLDQGYLEATERIAVDFSFLGAWGGGCYLDFEESPDPKLAKFIPYLGSKEVENAIWSNCDFQTVPIGAGMCVRSTIANRYLSQVVNDSSRYSLGRRGTSLMGGEDFDLCLTSWKAGLGTGLFPQLRLRHLIPTKRLQREYLFNIVMQSRLSVHLVQFLHFGEIPRRASLPKRTYRFVRSLTLRQSLFYQALQKAEKEAIVVIEGIQKNSSKQ